jgi:hypothetical protein
MRVAALVSLLVAVIATWPFILDPLGGMTGHPGNDVWNHVWGYWWVGHELSEGRWPSVVVLMGYPESGKLFFIDTFGALLTLPLQLLGGPVLAYNTAVFLSFFTAALAAWALARHCCSMFFGSGIATDQAAVLAAFAYGLAPHLLAQAYNGITETLNAGGLPLAILAALQLYERPTWVRALQAAGAGGLCLLANWYYGLFAVLGAALWLGLFALFRRLRVDWRGLVGPVVVAGVGALLLVSPALAAFSSSLEGGVVSRDPEFVWKQLLTHNVTDLEAMFHPGRFYSPDLKALHGEELLIVVYLGWSLLLMAGAGLFWALSRWRDRLPWLIWCGLFGVMALGPYLYIGGEHITLDDRKIPLPFLLFFDAIPAFERISHPFRFVVGVQLGLAILSSLAIRRLALPGVWLVAPVLVSSELLLGSPAVWPLPRSETAIPEVYTKLRDDPIEGAVLDLPLTVPNLERAVYLYWQTFHHRPSPYSLNEPLPSALGRSRLVRALLVAEGGRLDRLPPMLAELDLVVAGRALSRLGFRYIVVHDTLYPPSRLEQTLGILRAALGATSEVEENKTHLWRLEVPWAGEEQ